MQYGVAFVPPHLHLSSFQWECERGGCWASQLRKMGKGNEENADRGLGSSSIRRNQSTLTLRLGCLRNEMLGSTGLRRKLNAMCSKSSTSAQWMEGTTKIHASLMADPAVWVVRTAVFYVLLQSGLAGPGRSQSRCIQH
jgi:hypothetical protein